MKQQKYLDKKEREKLKAIIEEKTGYSVHSKYILSQAFRRRSCCAEEGGKSNEIFEFFGDQIISFYFIKIISEKCGSINYEGDFSFRLKESDFTLFKQKMVSNEALAKIIDQWDITQYMLVGRSDIKNRVDQHVKVKADLLEAIIGAIAFDSKWNHDVLEEVVARVLNLNEEIEFFVRDICNTASINIDNSVNTLKEMAEKEICSPPIYDIRDLGYDKNGNQRWSCLCCVEGEHTIARLAFASSKRDAKKAAAYLILCEYYELPNQYGDSSSCKIWTYKDGKLTPDITTNN